MEFFTFSDDGEENDDEIERERMAAIERNKVKETEARNKRIQQRQMEEDRRFPKIYKKEELTFLEYMQQEGMLLADDLKQKFRDGCQIAVECFGGENTKFVEEIKQIKSTKDLKTFIRNRYKAIVLGNENNENNKLIEWLNDFHLQTVLALEKMTQIPSDTHLYSSNAENIFSELQEDIKMHKDLHEFHNWRKENEIRDAEVQEEIRRAVRQELDELNLSGEETSRAARELARLSIDQIRHPHQDTSPDRRRISIEAERELVEQFKAFCVQEEPEVFDQNVTEPNNEFGNFGLFDDEIMEDDEDHSMPTTSLPPKTEWPGSKWKYFEYKSESESEEDEDLASVRTWKKELGYEERIPSYFGRHVLREDQERWKKMRFENKRKRNRNKIKFAAYDSPLNKMRIYIQPNDHFFADGDDGPTTDYVDMTLRDGSLYVHSVPGPFVLDYDLSVGTDTRRKDCIRNVVKQSLLTGEFLKEFISEYHGNFLGRFWFDRIPGLVEQSADWIHQIVRLQRGVVAQCTQNEIQLVYVSLSCKAYKAMCRSPLFYLTDKYDTNDKLIERAKVAGVLLLTDWRLAYLQEHVLPNVEMQYLPTNLGGVFFETMTEYLIEMILDATIEFHTIIFAFGGAPTFRKDDFLRFWKKLTVHTTKTYDVFWMAQDWWDGLQSTQEELDNLQDFNSFVEGVFESMNNAGFRNYKYCDIRKKYQVKPIISEETAGIPDISKLQSLYYSYVDFFVNECNCYGNSAFFWKNTPDQDDYATSDCRCPMRSILYSRPYLPKDDEAVEES